MTGAGRPHRPRCPVPHEWERVGAMNRADAWRDRGSYFSWSPRGGDAAEVQVFHVELGDADAPPLVLVHGFPTSSIDWFEVAERLSDRYRVCAMDFPGFGFSDKPLGWGYSLMRDAEVLEYYVAEVLGLESMIMLAHDRGSSVAMIHTTSGDSRVNLEHLFITNGNIFLPLSNLTQAQRLMLDPADGPRAARPGDAGAARGGHGPGDVHATARRRRPRDRSADCDLLARRGPRRSCTRRSSTWSSDRRTRTPGCRRSPRWRFRRRSSGASTTRSRRPGS